MANLREWWDGVWSDIQHSPTILPTRYPILDDHLDRETGKRFRRDEHYFDVTLNRMFLEYEREFWTTYAPMVLVVSEFDYNGQDTVVPFVVGPSLLEKYKIEMPSGFLFIDTRVAGLYPFKGGGLKLTVVLYRVKRTDLAKKLLKVIENMATVMDFSQALSSYLKIANILVDTVESLVGSDSDNQPLMGLREEFGPANPFKPGYYALFDGKVKVPQQSEQWVRGNDLLVGKDAASAQKFDGGNFVLYSIGQQTERDDFEKLPFYEQWKVAIAESWTKSPEKWESAKANWASLCQMMSLSPDLITPQSDSLGDQCFDQMKRNHERVTQKSGVMGAGEDEKYEDEELEGISARLDRVRSKTLAVLNSEK